MLLIHFNLNLRWLEQICDDIAVPAPVFYISIPICKLQYHKLPCAWRFLEYLLKISFFFNFLFLTICWFLFNLKLLRLFRPCVTGSYIIFYIFFLTLQSLRPKIRILILPISNNYRCNLSIQFPLTAVIVLRLNNLKSVRIRSDTVVPAVKVYLSYELLGIMPFRPKEGYSI